jgi:hypothetical protein
VLNYQKSVQVARLLLDTIFLYSAVEPVWIDVLRGRGSIYMFRHFPNKSWFLRVRAFEKSSSTLEKGGSS